VTRQAATPADLALLAPLTALIAEAAAVVAAFRVDELKAELKADQSPVTLADEAAHTVIVAGLARLMPGMPVVSEESREHALPEGADAFVLVDPLDGTKDFLAGRDEFTVNIALLRAGTPVLGLVAAPALGLIWRGAVGHGAERLVTNTAERLVTNTAERLVTSTAERLTTSGAERLTTSTAQRIAHGTTTSIRTRPWPRNPCVTVSRSHLDAETSAFVARLGALTPLPCGSSVKFCRIAEGAADLYPRLGPTSEWDIAAGHAVLAAAGGLVESPDRQPLIYGRRAPDFRVPGFVAWGDPQAAEKLR
jgi:3'(2'), 5'-bisphosphate nucleotidase